MENRYLHLFDSVQDLNNYITNDYEEPFVALTGGTRLDFNRSPIINNNGFSYVDLGLPSGTLWATTNLAVSNTVSYYYCWGETEQKHVQNISWSNYAFGNSASNLSKYNDTDGLTSLELEDDAARVKWGGNWRIPSTEQFQELIDNTTITSTYSGYIVLRSNINGKSINFQKNGGSPMGGSGSYGHYWTCDLQEDDKSKASAVVLSNGWIMLISGGRDRYCGLSIRPVLKPSPNIVEI